MGYNMTKLTKMSNERSIYMVAPIYASNNFIWRAMECGVNMTHLKLQKLLYILYARYLYKADTALFSDRFEAWRYGPVLTDIYDVFKREGASPLTAMRPDPNGEILIVVEDGVFGKCFGEVWNNYAILGAAELVNKTHEPNSAWTHAVIRNEYRLGGFLEDFDIRRDGEVWFE